jgi:hypothetical protein
MTWRYQHAYIFLIFIYIFFLSNVIVAKEIVTTFNMSSNISGVSTSEICEQSCYKYDAYRQNKLNFSIEFIIKPTLYKNKEVIAVFSHLSGTQIEEENICFLDIDTKKLLYVHQTTNNKFDNLFFKWEIDNTVNPAISHYYELKSRELISEDFFFPVDGYTVQAWLFILLRTDVNMDSRWDFNLLVPRNTFYRMQGKVLDKEILEYNSKEIECYKVEVALAGLFGIFFPKSYFWITTSSPHELIKYQDNKFIYKLRR